MSLSILLKARGGSLTLATTLHANHVISNKNVGLDTSYILFGRQEKVIGDDQ